MTTTMIITIVVLSVTAVFLVLKLMWDNRFSSAKKIHERNIANLSEAEQDKSLMKIFLSAKVSTFIINNYPANLSHKEEEIRQMYISDYNAAIVTMREKHPSPMMIHKAITEYIDNHDYESIHLMIYVGWVEYNSLDDATKVLLEFNDKD